MKTFLSIVVIALLLFLLLPTRTDAFQCLGSLDLNIYDPMMVTSQLSANNVAAVAKAQRNLAQYMNFCQPIATSGSGSGSWSTSSTVTSECFVTNKLCGSFCDTNPYPKVCREPSLVKSAVSAAANPSCPPLLPSQGNVTTYTKCPALVTYPFSSPAIPVKAEISCGSPFADPPYTTMQGLDLV